MDKTEMVEILPLGLHENETLIKVIGVGGGGSNAVTRMYNEGLKNVEFMICNTDRQALQSSPVPEKLQLGATLTKGLGAGCDPEKGRNAALESVEEIKRMMRPNIDMVFITAGMGGGTGTGASPIIAKITKDMGLLTIGVVTRPFKDESYETLLRAYNGIEELNKYVDSLLIIDNQKIYDIYGDLIIDEAFRKADNVLTTAVKGITEIITKNGYINVDLADVKAIMKDGGMALMGIGEGSGPNRAMDAVEKAFTSPLLNDFDLKTARNALINISTPRNNGLTMDEQKQLMDYTKKFTGANLDKFKRGICFTDNIKDDSISITIVATGFRMYLTPPSNRPEINQDENAVTMINEADEDEGIVLPIDGGSTPEIRIAEIPLENIPIYTSDKDISDFENETALDRRNRIMKEKSEKHNNQSN